MSTPRSAPPYWFGDAPVPGWAKLQAKAYAALAGLRRGDMVLAIDGVRLGDAQSLQKRMFADAIGTRMEITVLRNGALVDAVAEPAELTD